MIILGMKVIVDERAPEDLVFFAEAGHEWNPTKMPALVCRASTLKEVMEDPERRSTVEAMIRQVRVALARKACGLN